MTPAVNWDDFSMRSAFTSGSTLLRYASPRLSLKTHGSESRRWDLMSVIDCQDRVQSQGCTNVGAWGVAESWTWKYGDGLREAAQRWEDSFNAELGKSSPTLGG